MRKTLLRALPVYLVLLLPSSAFASQGGTSMPWDVGVNAILSNLTGNLAHAFVLGGLAFAGIIWAVTEQQTGMRRLGNLVFGGALAVGAVDAATTLGVLGALV